MNEVMIYKPNELIGIIERNNINRVARHLWTFLLQYAQQQIKFHDHKGVDFEVSVAEINGLAEIHQTNYKLLQNALECLMSPVRIRDDPKCYESVVPVTRIKIDIPNGMYKFRLEELVIQLLEETDYFTKIDVTEFNPFASKHSITIYEWLKRYERAPKIPEISVDELRDLTGTTKSKSYDNFKILQNKVIDVAVKEINEHTKYLVSYKTIKTPAKTRHKITSLQFEFKPKQEVIDTSKIEDSSADLERISIAEAISDARDVLNKHFRSDDSYRIQCSYFLNAFLCTEEEYYRATQLINYRALSWWLENKKTTNLKYFISDVKAGQRKGRFKDRIEFYKTLLGHLRPEQQELFKEAESRLGFKSLLERVLDLLNDNRKLDDSWL